MTIVRVPAGTPDGGRFAATARPEAALRLVVDQTEPVPAFPEPGDIASENRSQRAEEYAVRYHEIATHPAADAATRRNAVRMGLVRAMDTRGGFTSLPPDDGEAQSYVADAVLDDAKVDAAAAQVGRLSPDQAHTFTDRIAGALYDIEVADREQRLFAVAAANAPAPDASEEAWRARFADAPSERRAAV
ncbi:hypothetical protein [Nocardioides pakistanensis]